MAEKYFPPKMKPAQVEALQGDLGVPAGKKIGLKALSGARRPKAAVKK